MSTRQRLCLAVRLGNWRQSPLLITKCQKISKFLQLWMRCTGFHSTTLFVVTKNPSQSPLLTIYDKKIPAARKIFWGLSSTVSPFFPSPCSVQLMVVVIAVAKFGLLQRMWALLYWSNTRRGGHSLIWPCRVYVAEQSMPVFKALSLKQLGYTISLC